ncbi:hypothetical protein G9A89_006733 [Geosiphon pyriformis]|nr:hypothetical protein G9A89_006733 [Geosiphon pyriformis]
MNEQPTNLSSTNPLSRLISRNGKITTYKNYTSPLTEENLKLHSAMAPPPRESKTHHVINYVHFQRQLIALEAHLRQETEAAQEKFNSALPENTPSVIPEIIHIPTKISTATYPINNSTQPSTPIQNTFHPNITDLYDEDLTLSPLAPNPCTNAELLENPKKTISEIPTLFDSLIKNQKKNQRIKTMSKKIVKKLSFRSERNLTNRTSHIQEDDCPLPPSLSSLFEKDNASLSVETSIPPSPAQSLSLRSRNSSNRVNIPLKRIFIPPSGRPFHGRANSADTMKTFSIPPTSPTSSIHNNPAYTPLQPSTPITMNHLPLEPTMSSTLSLHKTPTSLSLPRPPSFIPNSFDNRDSGISLVPPSPKIHSREHSLSSLFRRVGNFSGFQKENQNINTININNNHEIELLAFRYPSVEEISDFTQGFINEVDHM